MLDLLLLLNEPLRLRLKLLAEYLMTDASSDELNSSSKDGIDMLISGRIEYSEVERSWIANFCFTNEGSFGLSFSSQSRTIRFCIEGEISSSLSRSSSSWLSPLFSRLSSIKAYVVYDYRSYPLQNLRTTNCRENSPGLLNRE